MIRFLVILAAILISMLPGSTGAEELEVWVSIQPQRFVVDHLGGDLVTTHVLVAPGQSPATYEISPKQMAGLADADLLISIGVPFEHALLPRLHSSAPDLQVIDGRKGVTLRTFAGDDASAEHSTDAQHHHNASSVDPHFWLDPTLMAAHAAGVADHLIRLLPSHEEVIKNRLEQLRATLRAADQSVADVLRPHRGRSFMAFHPAFGYLARRYGLEVVVVEKEGKQPGARELAMLTDLARRQGLTTVFVQRQFSNQSARALAAALGGKIVAIDPLADDYVANLDRMARAIADSLS